MPELFEVCYQCEETKEEVEHRRISFGSIQVREFDRVVGDHPDVTEGPPLSLGWGYSDAQECPVMNYEKARRNRKPPQKLNAYLRKTILIDGFHVPEEEIASAEKEVERTRRLREKTRHQKALSAKTEAVVQSARRKFVRILGAGKISRSS